MRTAGAWPALRRVRSRGETSGRSGNDNPPCDILHRDQEGCGRLVHIRQRGTLSATASGHPQACHQVFSLRLLREGRLAGATKKHDSGNRENQPNHPHDCVECRMTPTKPHVTQTGARGGKKGGQEAESTHQKKDRNGPLASGTTPAPEAIAKPEPDQEGQVEVQPACPIGRRDRNDSRRNGKPPEGPIVATREITHSIPG